MRQAAHIAHGFCLRTESPLRLQPTNYIEPISSPHPNPLQKEEIYAEIRTFLEN
jgi:hypothetical protein